MAERYSGISGIFAAPICADLISEGTDSALVILPTPDKAESFAETLRFFTDRSVFVLPDPEPLPLHYEAKSRAELDERLRALIALGRGEPIVIVAPASAALKKMLPPSYFFSQAFAFELSHSYNDSELRERLADMGYERVAFTESSGEYSIRGDIMDIFPADTELPLRLEFFDEELESIRVFDPSTQKSVRKLSSFELYPAAEFLPDEKMRTSAAEKLRQEYSEAAKRLSGSAAKNALQRGEELAQLAMSASNRQLLENYICYFSDDTVCLADYLADDAPIFIDSPARIRDSIKFFEEETLRDFESLIKSGSAVSRDIESFVDEGDVERVFSSSKAIFFSPDDGGSSQYSAKSPALMGGSMELLFSELKRYIAEDFEITIVCSSDDRFANLGDFLSDKGLTGQIHLAKGKISGGIELTSEKKVWLSDGDIFKSSKKTKRLRSMDDRVPIRAFTELATGDYVVHEVHGIARYEGIEQKTVQGVRRDYMKLAYDAGDLIFVPVDMMKIVHKYIGTAGERPNLTRLKTSEWKKAKARAKRGIADMAVELSELAARRKAGAGHAFSPDTPWQREFEDRFPYEETGDQLKAIQSVKSNMEKPEAMERLLCGDVGYGKTEVALRAVFKCVSDGKQAAVLVPTTILADQHYRTFSDRFQDFPFNVEVLSRFRSVAKQKKVLEGLERGSVDVVIGTHRLLSADVKFRDIGFLVIDEEQRFGVRAKEKIKHLKENIDVLSMTATPIPRTLHMSLMGIRDMDIIEEPPENRYPVQTYVMEESDEVIRDTILRELGRGGQVYAVTSRIEYIDGIAENIHRLVPEATVMAGHGRMSPHELENTMLAFLKGEADVLVSTTIIESGIDIPNVNTLLVFGADRFGLSQLYQLRGRVGRTDRVAYAYLLHQRDKVLTEVAEKRMRTIRDFAEFGAGFKIAIRDLEMRGAGDLLGSSQHGHMASIGYEMYIRLVEEAVAEISGLPLSRPKDEAVVRLDIPAYIPDYYIEDEAAKIEAYRNISLARDKKDEENILAELADRFGSVPLSVRNLLMIARLRYAASMVGILDVSENAGDLIFSFSPDDEKLCSAILQLIADSDGDLLRLSKGNPYTLRMFSSSSRLALAKGIELLEQLSEIYAPQ